MNPAKPASICSPDLFRRIFLSVKAANLFVLVGLFLAGCATNRAPDQPPSDRIFESPDVNSLHWLERTPRQAEVDPSADGELAGNH
jgi:hypothetical protein